MTTQKITAATLFQTVSAGRPVRVLLVREDAAKLAEQGISREPGLVVATRKTGVLTLAALEAEVRVTASVGGRRGSRDYRFRTSQGWTLWHSPGRNFIMAPEDAPTVKRAHAEAIEMDREREAAEMIELARAVNAELFVRARFISERAGRTPEAELEKLTEVEDTELPGMWEAADFLGGAPDEVRPPATAQPSLQEEGPTDWVQRLRPDAPPVASGACPNDWHRDPFAGPRALQPCPECPGSGYVPLAPGIAVAPIGSPRPSPEDLSDLELSLAAEMAEAREPGEEVPAADPVAVTMDVVTIHRGDRLYEVLEVRNDSGWDRVRSEAVDHSMARVAPCDPADGRDAQWVHLDLLHVRPPVASISTVRLPGDPLGRRVGTETVALSGGSWDPVRGMKRKVVMLPSLGAGRLPGAHLWPVQAGPEPTITLRAGEAVMIDGRCFRVVDLGGAEPVLEPARWRARLLPA